MFKANRKAIKSIVAAWLVLASIGLAHGQADAFGVGAQGADVFAVQGMLKSLGYYAGVIDGKFGPQAAAGVRFFQKNYGLPVTGAVDGKTLQAILWAYGQLKIPQNTPPSTPPQKTPAAPSELSHEELSMLELVNKERLSHKLSALSVDSKASSAAETKSRDMVENEYFSHQSPTYGTPFEMMKQFGIDYRTAGENIACNQNVEAAHQALMNSQGHRENILNPQFTHIGIGIVNGGRCGKMFTQMFIGR